MFLELTFLPGIYSRTMCWLTLWNTFLMLSGFDCKISCSLGLPKTKIGCYYSDLSLKDQVYWILAFSTNLWTKYFNVNYVALAGAFCLCSHLQKVNHKAKHRFNEASWNVVDFIKMIWKLPLNFWCVTNLHKTHICNIFRKLYASLIRQ